MSDYQAWSYIMSSTVQFEGAQYSVTILGDQATFNAKDPNVSTKVLNLNLLSKVLALGLWTLGLKYHKYAVCYDFVT